MSGSSPLADAGTRSTGTGAVLPGSAARSVATRSCTGCTRSGFVGLRFEPDEEPALSGNGEVADGRPQKYLGSSNGCPIRAEPTGLPFLRITLPLACCGNATWETRVTPTGYTIPVMSVSKASETIAARQGVSMLVLHYTQRRATKIMRMRLIPGKGMRTPPTP